MAVADFPDHIWEAARSLRNAVNWQSNASVEIIAAALYGRDRRAAAILAEEAERWPPGARVDMRAVASTVAKRILSADDEAGQ